MRLASVPTARKRRTSSGCSIMYAKGFTIPTRTNLDLVGTCRAKFIHKPTALVMIHSSVPLNELTTTSRADCSSAGGPSSGRCLARFARTAYSPAELPNLDKVCARTEKELFSAAICMTLGPPAAKKFAKAPAAFAGILPEPAVETRFTSDVTSLSPQVPPERAARWQFPGWPRSKFAKAAEACPWTQYGLSSTSMLHKISTAP
mmetsp:Transcript_8393/g.23190  ORF Transcript_8393/g.23190 Transcript_8393/m.23190 type:complete len:204 (-) Transcript_8393:1452-2063(-)